MVALCNARLPFYGRMLGCLSIYDVSVALSFGRDEILISCILIQGL